MNYGILGLDGQHRRSVLCAALLVCLVGACKKDKEEPTQGVSGVGPTTVSDADGTTYRVVHIGSQWWMAEDLHTTRYRDGTTIRNATSVGDWSSLLTGAWCNYDNDPDNDPVYGKLYNFYAIIDPHGLCPTGWHVPSDIDWQQLESAYGMLSEDLAITGQRGDVQNVGGKMKSVELWHDPNSGATSAFGFAALPAGFRGHQVANFDGLTRTGAWWTSSESATDEAWSRTLYYYNRTINRASNRKRYGFCVRCVQD